MSNLKFERKIEPIPVGQLRPYSRNARTHSRKQIRQIAESIKHFGFTLPLLIDETNMVLAGHGRLAAAKLLKLPAVPCIRLDHMSEADKRAYILADNKLAANAGWDEELVALELTDLSLVEGLDLTITGFSIPEIDLAIEGSEACAADEQEDPIPHTAPRRVYPGDLWELGEGNLLFCGDARDSRSIDILMQGEQAQLVLTDPPYNVNIDKTFGNATISHHEFAMASGEMSPEHFTKFLREAFHGLAKHVQDGAIVFVFMDWRHITEVYAATQTIFGKPLNLIVWVKDNAGMGTFYRSQHEFVLVFKHGPAAHLNNFELGQHGRHRTNVWRYRGQTSTSAERMKDLALHPTVKPVAMLADAIRDVTKRKGIVLDVFAGSGSTLLAALKTGRRARLCEISPAYCDIILQRYETTAKDDAVQLACGWPRQPEDDEASLQAVQS